MHAERPHPARPRPARPRAAPRRGPLALGLALLCACGDGVRTLPVVDCDPIGDEGCPAGTHCRLVGDGALACLAPVGAGAAGCVAGSCPSGEACVELEGALACRRVCAVGADGGADGGAEGGCPAPARCAYTLGESPRFGLCSPACALGEACGVGQTCTATALLDHLVCAAAGALPEGAPCGEEARCGAGLACLLSVAGVARCAALCDPEAGEDSCARGACVGRIRQVPGVGFCTG